MGCRNGFSKKHCECHCHQKEKCNCEKEIHCKTERLLTKDCMKIDWAVPEGETQTIYQAGGLNQLFGSGFVSYDEGDAPYIIVRFYLNGVQQGMDIVVFEDSSVAFNYTRFDRVSVSCSGIPGGSDLECEGELSIVSRFPTY